MNDALASERPGDIARDYEEMLQLLYTAPVGLAQISRNGDISLINPWAAKLLMPLSRDGALTNLFTVLDAVAPQLRQATADYPLQQGMVVEGLHIELPERGRAVRAPRMLSLTLLKLDHDRLVATINDATKQFERERLLAGIESRSRSAAVADADAYETLMQFLYRTPIGLVQTDLDGVIDMINPMAASLLMPLTGDGNLENLFTVLQEVVPGLREIAAGASQPGGMLCDARRIPLAGGERNDRAAPQVLSLSLMRQEPARLMAVLTDATLEVQRERQSMARRLDAAARIDSLTQMPNRAALRERLQKAAARASTDPRYHFAVLFMNCDRLKQINDTLGNAAGDEVLGLMADRLRSALRVRDQVGRPIGEEPMAARVGGDEFVVMVVLDELGKPDHVHVVAQRLVELLAKPYGVGQHQLYCSVSMGVVLQHQAASDADAILQDASTAMVEAKRAGGARYVVFGRPCSSVRHGAASWRRICALRSRSSSSSSYTNRW